MRAVILDRVLRSVAVGSGRLQEMLVFLFVGHLAHFNGTWSAQRM